MATLSPGDFLLVKNNSDKKLSLGWNSRDYSIDPGNQQPVPMEAVVNAFGDPRSSDVVRTVRFGGPDSPPAFIADRESEVRRLRCRWGILDGPENTFENAEGEVKVPEVEVYTLDGERVNTVIDDPSGEKNAPSTITQATNLHDLIEHQQQQIDLLKAQLDIVTQPNTASNEVPAEDEGSVTLPEPVDELPKDTE